MWPLVADTVQFSSASKWTFPPRLSSGKKAWATIFPAAYESVNNYDINVSDNYCTLQNVLNRALNISLGVNKYQVSNTRKRHFASIKTQSIYNINTWKHSDCTIFCLRRKLHHVNTKCQLHESSFSTFSTRRQTDNKTTSHNMVPRWRSGRAFMGSIPGPGVISHLGQLSLPSLRVGKSSTSLHRLGLRRGVLAYVGLQVKLWTQYFGDTP